MEFITLLLALYGGYALWKNKIKGILKPLNKDTEYFIKAQNALIKFADIDLETAKGFVLDHQEVLYNLYYKKNIDAEQAVLIICANILSGALIKNSGVLVKGGDHLKNMDTAMNFAIGIQKYLPNSKIALEFQHLAENYVELNIKNNIMLIRAYIFLDMVEKERKSVSYANEFVSGLDEDMPEEVILDSYQGIDKDYNGKASIIMDKAKSMGFVY